MSKYSDKLKNPLWQRKRLEILNRDDFTCCKCGDKETELHVHHLKYTGEPHEAPNEDLETLCKDCHRLVENLRDVMTYNKNTTIKKFKGRIVLNSDERTFIYNLSDPYDNVNFLCFPRNSPILKFLYEINLQVEEREVDNG